MLFYIITISIAILLTFVIVILTYYHNENKSTKLIISIFAIIICMFFSSMLTIHYYNYRIKIVLEKNGIIDVNEYYDKEYIELNSYNVWFKELMIFDEFKYQYDEGLKASERMNWDESKEE